LDVIPQFLELSFLFLGLLILVWPKYEDEFSFARTLRFLGAFGLTHGFIEWMELWHGTHGDMPLFDTIEPFILLLSYLFLFEFGRRLIRSNLSAKLLATIPGHLLAPWLYIVMFGAVAYGTAFSRHSLRDFTILSQYIFGFGGAVLSGIGFFIYWDRYVKAKLASSNNKLIKIAFHVLAISCVSYGVLGGLFAPPAEWFPDSRLDNELFITLFHFPVRIARTLSAVLAVTALVYILRIFYFVSWKGLSSSRADAERDKPCVDHANRRYEILLQAANDGIHVLDIEGDVVEANAVFCQMLGYTQDEILRMNVRQWDAHFSAEELKQRLPEFINKRAIFETRHRRRDGKVIDVEVSTVGVHFDDTPLLYCASRDITDRKHAEEQLRLVSRVFDRAAEGVMITDEKQRILTVNDSFTSVTGYAREEVIGKTPAILQSGKQGPDFYKEMRDTLQNRDWWQGEIWNRRKNGELYVEWLSINVVRDENGKIINYVGMFSDITLIKESRQRMEFLATHDELTKLPNRSMFNEHLKLALARSRRSGTQLALLFVDLDNFKLINDTLGHEEGDELLKQVAGRLKTCVREMDTVARLGGDEFVVLLEIEERNKAGITAKRVLEAFTANFVLKDQEYKISPSIGISLFPEDASDPKILMSHADTAMYRAKERGKNTYQFFTKEMAEHISHRLLIERSLQLAISNNEFCLEYQPLINFKTNELVGVEALLRWRHRGEIILPGTFIHIAEESGLIVDIDNWVIGEVCRQLRVWNQTGLPPFWVSINISARHFRRPNIFSQIMGIISLANISPKQLSLEITESNLMDVETASRMLRKLHEVGFRISVDDFGTGFSSLSYLKRFPLSELKIDRSFVDGIADEAEDRSITTAIVAIARELGLNTVAEGVETEAQHEVLKKLGCDIGQGYLYSRPLPGSQVQDWLLFRGAEKVARSGR
jgi:diguanylate cyclase (GGDEF)-like protein/PAS domain S-box-containing protein